MGGRVAGKAEIITNLAQLGLELGLSLAKVYMQLHWGEGGRGLIETLFASMYL